MDPNWFFYLVFILASLFSHAKPILAVAPAVAVAVAKPSAQSTSSSITVIGSVYCDVCFDNSFTKYSYFLPGVDVHIQCKFEANSPRTTEKIAFSVNRTTDRQGIYKLDIPSIDGVDCVNGPTIQSFCQASLIGSSSSSCNVPGLSSTPSEITVKSKQNNLCIYSVSALNYRPAKRNITLCGTYREQLRADPFNSSKFFLPFFPPYFFPWPPLPQLPPWPQLPPLPPLPSLPPLPPLPQLPPFQPFPSFPFPPLPSLPPLLPLPPLPYPPSLPIPQPPPLPFPFPPLPPFTPSPFQLPPPPSPPTFYPRDPRTWIPNFPAFAPPPPAVNLRDPRTWIPNFPAFAPPPPAVNLRDPRSWIPYLPPSPPYIPQSQHP